MQDLVAITIIHLYFLAGGVPYNITVKAVNLAGCGQERHIYCFTEEGGIYTRFFIRYSTSH